MTRSFPHFVDWREIGEVNLMNRGRMIYFGLGLVCFFLVIFSGTGSAVQAAMPLVAGDIAIIGLNTDNPDEFAFVLLANVSTGEEINFTDNGWLASGSFRGGEGSTTWTAPADLCAGTVISPDVGTMLFSASGDQILAYQGLSTSPTLVYALNDEGAGVWQADATSSNTSALPTGLTNGTTAVALNEIDNAIYTGITSGTRAALLAAISDNSNWSGSNSARQTMPSGPFTVTDAAPCGGDAAPAVSTTTPASGASGVAIDANIDLTFSEDVSVDPNWFDISCGTSGVHTAVVSGGPLSWTLNPDVDFTAGEICTVTIDDVLVHDIDVDDPPDTMTADYIWNFTIAGGGGCGVGNTLIHAIQGSGAATPIPGATVSIQGVVVGDFQLASELDGFFVQEEDGEIDGNPLTSEGIFVFDPGGTAVAPGDIVQVSGTVTEFFNLTEINNVTNITNCGSGSVTATSVNLPFPSATYLEQFEGMLIQLPQPLVVTEHFNLGRGGYLVMSSNARQMQPTQVVSPGVPANNLQLANDLNRIIVDDGSLTQNPDPIEHPAPGLSASNTVRGGYTAAGITGVLSYGYDGWSGSPDNYRLHPTAVPAFNSAPNPRPTAPTPISGTVRVASFNVLNYFNGDGLGGGFPTPRGADSPTEFTRQRDKIIPAILGLDAHVIGLMELENDYGDLGLSAIADLVSGLNAAAGSPGDYAYIDPGTATLGSDAIAVGILYRTSVVTPTGPPATIGTGAFAARNRQPLAQTFSVGLESFTVVVNHLKSKGSDCDDGTMNDPDNVFPNDPDTGDGQGNCNLTRVIAVNEMLTWLAGDPTGSGDPDFMIMGDINAYAKEDPITTLQGAGYVNLGVEEQGYDSYSFVFNGQWGSLDHVMANASLTAQVAGVTVWHINADEPRSLDYNTEFKTPGQVASLYNADQYRASDHDPVVVGLLLGSQSDFSDLTPSYGVAWHLDNGTVWLGSLRTNEVDFALGHDDVSGGDDSDDGVVVVGPWSDGANGGTLAVTVSGVGNGCLYGWLDWDQDGVFDRSTAVSNLEYIIRAETGGSGNYSFEVPAGTFDGSGGNRSFNLRVRLYEDCSSGPTGPGLGGEVEDGQISFTPTAITIRNTAVVGSNTAVTLVLLLAALTGGLTAVFVIVRRNSMVQR